MPLYTEIAAICNICNSLENIFFFGVPPQKKPIFGFSGNLICKNVKETQMSKNEKLHSNIFLKLCGPFVIQKHLQT